MIYEWIKCKYNETIGKLRETILKPFYFDSFYEKEYNPGPKPGNRDQYPRPNFVGGICLTYAEIYVARLIGSSLKCISRLAFIFDIFLKSIEIRGHVKWLNG